MRSTFTNAAAFIARATLAALASTVVLSVAVSPAWADPAQQTRSAVVSTDGLNLNNSAGQATLQHRLIAAAHRVCRTNDDTRQLDTDPSATQACVDAALQDAQAGARRAVAAAQASGMVASAGAP